MNQNTVKAFAGVTVRAGLLFALPVGYFYGRPYLLKG